MNKKQLKQLRASGRGTHNQLRRFTGLANGSALEVRTFRGVDYDVVPILSIRDNIVVRGLGSTTGEFVPADVLVNGYYKAANSPVVLNHPVNEANQPISANSIEVLESSQLGYSFEPEHDGGIVLNCFLNDELVSAVDSARGDTEASDILSDLRAGKDREVSIGVMVHIVELEGEYEGEPYGAVWLSIEDFDHLAILDSDSRGACSNADGCGPLFDTLREAVGTGATNATMRAAGNVTTTTQVTREQWKAYCATRERVRQRNLLLNGELNDQEIRQKLYGALSAAGYWDSYIKGVYTKQKRFTYEVWISDDSEDGQELGIESSGYVEYLRGYKLKDGIISLKNDKQLVTGYTPVVKDLSIGNVNSQGVRTMTDEEKQEQLTEAVDKLIACSKCPFEESDREFIESKGLEWVEATFTRLSGSSDGDDNNASVEPAATSTPVVPLSDYQALANEVAEMRPHFERMKADEKAERKLLTDAILKAKPEVYNRLMLDGFDIEAVRATHQGLGLARLSTPTYPTYHADYSASAGGASTTPKTKPVTIPRSMDALRNKSKRTLRTPSVDRTGTDG